MTRKTLTLEEKKIRTRINMYRRWSMRDPKRIDVIINARRPYNGPNKKQKWEVQCAMCKKWFKQSEVQVDHIIPCGSYLKPEDEEQYRYNLVNSPMQILCKEVCHRKKTNEENASRREKK